MIGSLNLAVILKIQVTLTCFDIILKTEHARQKLNTKTAEPYFLREGKSGSAIRVDSVIPVLSLSGRYLNTPFWKVCHFGYRASFSCIRHQLKAQSRTQSNACARARMALALGKLNFSCAVIGFTFVNRACRQRTGTPKFRGSGCQFPQSQCHPSSRTGIALPLGTRLLKATSQSRKRGSITMVTNFPEACIVPRSLVTIVISSLER